MYKSVIILYFIVFSAYILFSRQPDYFDGEIIPGIIHWSQDSISHKPIPKAYFTIGKDTYSFDARYVLRNLPEAKKIRVIYQASQPQKAVVYSWWGYWITAVELVASVVLLFVLFQIAVVLTKNPTAESVIEQMDYKPEKKRRYND